MQMQSAVEAINIVYCLCKDADKEKLF